MGSDESHLEGDLVNPEGDSRSRCTAAALGKALETGMWLDASDHDSGQGHMAAVPPPGISLSSCRGRKNGWGKNEMITHNPGFWIK